MDTRYTMRARQLRDIYNSINMKYATQDERLDALLTLKQTVKVIDYTNKQPHNMRSSPYGCRHGCLGIGNNVKGFFTLYTFAYQYNLTELLSFNTSYL